MTTEKDPKRRILVADDDPAILRLVTALLEKEGYTVLLSVMVVRHSRHCKKMLISPLQFSTW